ncbi:MAG: DNA polymerase III subunit alpha [Bacteroidota bacterium]|nr:DNA polymerase III subunit alpha [Sphingobacteriales bacterium]
MRVAIFMLLNCHTYFSLRYGTLSVEALLAMAKQQGYTALALTDINNTSAWVEALRLAPGFGLEVKPGIDFRNGVNMQYVGIAQNNRGLLQLNEHLSYHLHHGLPFDVCAPDMPDVFIIYPFASAIGRSLRVNEFVGIGAQDLLKTNLVQSVGEKKMVALHTVSFTDKRSYNAHRLLRAIDNNTLLSMLPKSEQGNAGAVIPSADEMQSMYRQYPILMRNTERLLNNCHAYIEFGKFANKNLHCYTGSAAGDMELLKTEAEKGMAYRYGNAVCPDVHARVEKELRIISQMDFASYFLINMDIVRYAQHKGYYYVGRGSGANSILAYLLRITDVDPIALDLYFERFINPYRSTPPDFDIDFSWTDRDDITRYIFDRFGRHRTALLGSYNTFQFDAVVRELGKVFGLPAHEINKLQATRTHSPDDENARLILRYADYLRDFPSHLSIHASGLLIAEEPIHAYTATFMPPKGYATTHFSMIEAEDIGLYKFDILSQRGLGKIKDTLGFIGQNRHEEVDIHQTALFMNDEPVKQLLREGKTMGCFYIESPAMRMLLTKLQADDYLRLVAASSIIRPGVSKSGMMNAYIERYRNPAARQKAQEALPEMYDVLKETYGVMVYQEDVIKVAHKIADLSLADADYLRRGMSWKFKQRNEFWRVRDTFFTNCRNKGYAEKTIEDIWFQIESFANFAFSKAHSASYAVESFQALYLKAHYPLEYMVATLNNGGGFYRKEFYVNEARLHGGQIEMPCVNHSEALSSISGKTIWLGFHLIAELEEQVMYAIADERKKGGAFLSLADFMKRLPVSIEQMRLLIRADAFRFTGKSRKILLWEVHVLADHARPLVSMPHLFAAEDKPFDLPELEEFVGDHVFDEMILIGFPVTVHPFTLLKATLDETLTAADLKNMQGKVVCIVGYYVTHKRTSTSAGQAMFFGTFLDLNGQWIDTVHFPPVAKVFPFRGRGCYRITGKLINEYDFLYIEVQEMERLPEANRDSYVHSTRLKQID